MSIVSLFKKAVNTVVPGAIDLTFTDVIEEAYNDYKTKDHYYYYSIKATDSEVFTKHILPFSDKHKVAFIAQAAERVYMHTKDGNSLYSNDKRAALTCIWEAFMKQLLRSKLVLDDDDISILLYSLSTYQRRDYRAKFVLSPLSLLVAQIEKQSKDRKLSDEVLKELAGVKDKVENEKDCDEKEKLKLVEKISQVLFNSENTTGSVKPTWFPGNDEFADYGNAVVKALKDDERDLWFKLMKHSQKASGGSPSKKYLEEAKQLFKEFGADKFKQVVNDWFQFVTAMKEKVKQQEYNYGGGSYTITSYEFISQPNVEMLKGFIWICVHLHDKATLYNIASLADRAYRKIPGQGPTAAAIGNACIYVLAHSKGLDGVGHLSRLRLRIKQQNTQNLIEKYLYKAAEQQGVSISEIEDMAVDDYGLENGAKAYEFDGYKAEIKITSAGKTDFNWYKPDGTPQKAVPAFVKEKYAAKLKKIKDTVKQIDLTTTAQRDRIERMFISGRTWNWQQFNEFYFTHGLMSFLTYKLIWFFEKEGKREAALYLDGEWVNPEGKLSFQPDEGIKVSLWHPVFCSIDEIRKWRTFLIDQKIVQPLKQAFREVYLLTEAEENTGTYSNRMAAHILKQHQFNSLAKLRGWKYTLMGSFDHGSMNATINLPDYNLRAEFWINEINADDAMSDTGIWLYVATDQVRFCKLDTGDVLELIDVPALVFTEIMRDVDLFVGVASVGNDPVWRDSGGLPAYRDYWQAYSFGDLTEVAKTRKTILERLVPRLKIAKVTEIKDKFLVVKGKLRTYKIHIGSTNILMEPNDQYLCIVPDRSARNVTENLFLPFEGDNGVSVILSKAMLLADDDKITDSTITSQIKRR